MSTYNALAAPIRDLFPELAEEEFVFSPPPNLDMGDVALRTFGFAQRLRSAPQQIAARIANEVDFGPDVVSVTTAGPYVNFRLDRGAFARRIVTDVMDRGKAYGSSGSGTSKTALIEHTSINPNASPHLGRARNAMIGDSVVRLLRFEGYRTETHYYVNDIGRQIALLVLSIDDPMAHSFDDMLRLYQEANARAEAEPEFAERGYEMLARIEQGDPEVREKFYRVTEMCLQGQLLVLARLGVGYDEFMRESRFVQDPRLDRVLEALRERDCLFVDEEDRLVVDLRHLGHTPDEGRYFVLMRANGSSMYGYRDLAYTIDKIERGPDLNVIVLGEDHKLYFNQLALILKAAGYEAPEPIYYSYILLKEGKMSTRQGKVVLLSDFLDEASARAQAKVDEQCKDMPAPQRKAIASKVAVAAIRFAILRVNPSKNVIFDWENSLSFTGDTGPYVQYSCARIASILRKYGNVPPVPPEPFPLDTDAEWVLAQRLAEFPGVVEAAVQGRSVAPVAQYALDVARQFTVFYHECPVLTAPSDELKSARVCVCAATLQVLSNALALLGIEALDRM